MIDKKDLVEDAILVCNTDRYMHLTKDTLYVIQNVKETKKHSWSNYIQTTIKLKGTTGRYDPSIFTLAKDNVAVNRSINLAKLIDKKINIQDKKRKSRKIETMQNRNSILMNVFFEGVEYCNLKTSSFDDIVAAVVRKDRRYQLEANDYEKVANMTLKDIFDNFTHIKYERFKGDE